MSSSLATLLLSCLSSLPRLTLSLLLFLLFAGRISRRQSPATTGRKKYFNFPPGPPKLPIVGNLHQLIISGRRGLLPHRALWDLSRKHGPLMHLQLGAVPAVAVSSGDVARLVLKTHDLDFCSRPDLVSHRTISYGYLDVAFAPYGEYWRQMRKVCAIELFGPKRVESFRRVREEEVSQFIQNVNKSSSVVINLSEMLVSLTNGVTCRSALGKSYRLGRFHRLLAETTELSTAFFVEDYFPSTLGWVVDVITGKKRRLRKAFEELDAFYEEVIDEHLDPATRSQDHEREDFVDALIKVQKELGFPRDHIKGVLMNIFFGGTESSSTVMEWTMTELMKNRRILHKAQEEVRRVVTAAGKHKVEESELHRLHYLKSVIKETLRLHPPAPLLVPHATTRDCRVLGYDIAAGTRVFVNVLAIGRDPEYWDSPDEFRPERFSGDVDAAAFDYDGSKAGNFGLIPFGAGRRGCPGVNLGMVIVELALANLLYAFDWEFPSAGYNSSILDIDQDGNDEAHGIAMHRKFPLLVVPTSVPHHNMSSSL